MKITKIVLEPGNRMVGARSGQNKDRWFFRVDLWKVAFRLTK